MRNFQSTAVLAVILFLYLPFTGNAQDFIFSFVKGKAKEISIGPDGTVLIVNPTTNQLQKYDRKTKKFVGVETDASFTHAVGTQDILYGVDNKKALVECKQGKCSKTKPAMLSGDISMDKDGKVWGVFPTNGKMYSYDGNSIGQDKKYGTAHHRIAARHRSDIWTLKKDNTIRWFFKSTLRDVEGKAKDIAVDKVHGTAYIVGMDGKIYRKTKKDWKDIGATLGNFEKLAVHDGEIWALTKVNSIFRAKLDVSKVNEGDFSFKKDKKKVVILVHGITLGMEKENAIKEKVGTYKHPQFYWGFDFIRQVAGVNEKKMTIIDPPRLAGNRTPTEVDNVTWSNHNHHGFLHSDAFEENPMAYLLTAPTAKADVMLTFRDGSESLMTQTKDAINQIFMGYQAHYGHLPENEQPMIYLVAHSFGGIVSRTIFSIPTEEDLFGVKLNHTDKLRANFIRNRTVSLTTLSTPHEGSPLPGIAKVLNTVLDFYDSPSEEPWGLAKDIRTFRRNDIAGDGECMTEIDKNNHYLKGMLRPENAKRENGDLIPIYTLAGANPGNIFYLHKRADKSPFDNSGNDLKEFYDIKKKKLGYNKVPPESSQLAILDHVAKSEHGINLWPKAELYTEYSDRYNTQRLGAWLYDITVGGISFARKPDGIYDSDGFVGFHSSHALKLGTKEPLYFNNNKRYNVDGVSKHGSWYRIFGERYGKSHPWDYDNHRSICFNPGNGAFIGKYLLWNGPYAQPGDWSSWNKIPHTRKLRDKKVSVEITYLRNEGEVDFGSEGYSANVKIGHGKIQNSGIINETEIIGKRQYQSGKNYVWTFSENIPNATIIPITIDVWNKRGGVLSSQHCSLSQLPYVESIVLYLDVYHKRIYGEVEQQLTGQPITVVASSKSKRPMKIQFRIKVE